LRRGLGHPARALAQRVGGCRACCPRPWPASLSWCAGARPAALGLVRLPAPSSRRAACRPSASRCATQGSSFAARACELGRLAVVPRASRREFWRRDACRIRFPGFMGLGAWASSAIWDRS
jgi:hypothetical protein